MQETQATTDYVRPKQREIRWFDPFILGSDSEQGILERSTEPGRHRVVLNKRSNSLGRVLFQNKLSHRALMIQCALSRRNPHTIHSLHYH